ncbi:C-5 cytosine-specific DNA methylase [Apiospora kogelbergensis]|uniref:C-5 cytosine-specific DNA methylase n=1 Tax=Apiospora kogelbergensis TaxID=1337665 RepID=UPI00312E896B
MNRCAEAKDEPALSPEQLQIEQKILRPSLCRILPSTTREIAGSATVVEIKEEDVDEDNEDSSELWDAVAEVIDLTEDEPASQARRQKAAPRRAANQVQRRNEPIEPQLLIPDRDSVVKRGHFVELEAPLPDPWETSFLLVQEVFRRRPEDHDDDVEGDADDGWMLRGLPFTRTRCLRGKLPRHRNEVCLVLQVDADDARPDRVQAAVDVPLRRVRGPRQFHFTNARFPAHRFDGASYAGPAEVERAAPLTCRWTCRLVYKDAAARRNKAGRKAVPSEFVMMHVGAGDEGLRAKFRVRDSVRLNQWRGGKVAGGSYDQAKGVDLALRDDLMVDDDEDVESTRATGQAQLAHGGGASYGARCAGFHVRTACDHWKDALETYRHNFPETELHGKDIFALLAEVPDDDKAADLHVDVLHLSPPCQFWSPAHTVAGKHDEQNIAALMACNQLIDKFRPRLFTLEQTFGILDPRFEYYFNALLLGFTQHGYSVRWRVLRLENWGLPSPRKRLIMLGACPGEPLPDYPSPTHAQTPVPGVTNAYRTVYESLRGLPPPNDEANRDADPLHHFHKTRDDAPWDPDRLLPRAITCNGGYGNHHWSGQRDFTRREYATLNGFPRRYEFRGRHYQRQIGNAFPARFTRCLYRHLRRCLERADAGLVRANPGDWVEVAFGDGDEGSEDGEGGRGEEEEGDEEVLFQGRRFRGREPAPLALGDWKDDDGDEDGDDDDVMEIDVTGDGEVVMLSDRPAFLCVDANQRAPPLEAWNFPASSQDNPIDLDSNEVL